MALQGSYRNSLLEDTSALDDTVDNQSGLSSLSSTTGATTPTGATGTDTIAPVKSAAQIAWEAQQAANAERDALEYAAQQKAAADNVTDLGDGTYRLADGRVVDSDGNLVTATKGGLSALDTTGGTGATDVATSASSPVASAAQQYLDANPDVKAEYEKFHAQDPNRWTPESYTAYHYSNYGQNENRAGSEGISSNIDNLANQILGQGLTAKWTGEGKGSAEANAKDMASILTSIGITDINDFGQITKTIPGYSYETEQGTVDVPEQTVTTYGNKKTGQEVPNTYSERQTGNFFGGTFAGSGNTGYGVQFDANGRPYFYTAGASSNDLANIMKNLGPLGQIGLAIATGGLSIPEQIAANMAMQVLSGKDIGDAIKSAAVSYAGAQIPGLDAIKESTSFLNGIDSTGVLAKAFQNAAVSGATAALSGKNIGDAMLQGAVTGGTNGAVNALMGNIEGFNGLTDAQKKMAINAVTGVISGKPLDQIVINTAIAAANAEVAKAKDVSQVGDGTSKQTPSGLDAVSKEIDNQTTIDASGAMDLNAAAKFAQEQGYTKFTFDGKTYDVGSNDAAKIADLEKTVKAEQDALKLATKNANLAGSEFAGVDQAVADAAKRNVVTIGNDEAETPEQAAALAKVRDPSASQFTFGGQTYTMGGSNAAVDQAFAQAKAEELKNNIANAPSKAEAFKIARDGLGAGQTFTWNGQTFSTNTAQEQIDALNKANLAASTEASAQTAARNRGAINAAEANIQAINATNLANMSPEMRAVVQAQNDMAARDAAARADAARIAKATNAADDLAVDAMGNTVSGSMNLGSNELLKTTTGKITNGVANAMNTFFGAVANTPIAAVQAGGNLLGNAGGIIDLVAGTSTEAGNKLRELAGQVDKFSDSISDPQIKIQQQKIGEDVDKAEGLTGKTAALISSALNNPLGAANWVFTEGFEEVPGVGMALKAGSKIARYGISIANDMMESGGAAYNDTYKAAKAQGMNEDQARAAARNSSLAAMVATGVTGGVVEGKLLSKAIGKESVGELAEGSAQAAAAQLALGKDLNVNDILTQGVIEMGVGKGASSTANAVTATNINNDITAAATSGDAGSISTAITNSVQNSLSNGASVSTAVGTSVGSAITNGADANSSIITAVTSALDNGADVGETITSSITSAISAGADATVAIDSTVTSAITGGADAATTVGSAVTSAMTSGADASTSIASAVQAAVGAGTNVTTATNAATSAAVTSAISGGTDVSTAITNAVSGAVAAGADTNTATTAATGAAVTSAITNGTDASTAITSAVTAAVDAGADVVTASNAAVSSAVTSAVTSGTDVATAISSAVTAAVDAGSNVTAATNAATTAAVTSAISAGTDASTAITNAVNGAVDAGADVTTATSTAVTASVTAAISSGANVSTTVSNAVQTAVDAGVDANTVVGNTITAAITAGADVNTAVTSAVTTAISAGSDANTSIATAVNSAITSGVNSTTAINAAVQAAIAAGVDTNEAINTAVNTAVTVNATSDANTDTSSTVVTNADANVDSNVGLTTNVDSNATTNADTTLTANADLPVVGGLPTTIVADSGQPTGTLSSIVTSSPEDVTTDVSPTEVSKPVTPKPPTKPTKVTKSGLPSMPQFADPVLDSSPQFLKGAGGEKAMQLASLKQLYSSLTPEMQEIFAERGFKPPEEERSSDKESDKESEKEDKKKKKSAEDKTYEELMAEEDAKLTPEQIAEKYGTKLAASGGSILDSATPKFIESAKGLTAAPVVGTGGVDSPLKLMGIKHLREGIAKAPRPLGGYAKGGLPTKYAEAAPKGHNPEFITGLTGYYASGDGTGQSDDIPAMLHDGDYVIDADAVAALGDGSSKAGAEALANFQKKVPHSMATGGTAVPAKIADGEYVFPAAFVSALGGGDNKKGAKLLDAMREELRAHKRSAPTSKIPPKAKSPLDYLRMAKG